ncbi:branched chain amino acid aminotransferase [Candidatus Woesearchaeota archaeon CG11_big_fil_rev_8_21_14_0_20_43_8]|nr:MAG: branched chain amino acid aminotransferase [Candidatus Woesearchaeota archaeon CG11_big_fil_rev_8_21_14_0_20_43_8]PIO05565.1 MAG: branched chain amino acid aminotransferase [Candidatus Woesearchaeota archaeon CG08_land_8_20_14_0_20_43_7]
MIELKKIWMDGKLVTREEAKVDFLTHALHYGTAVFEGIRCYETPKGPAIFKAKEHIDRFLHSEHIFGRDLNYTREQLVKALKDTVKANGLKSGYIRPLAFMELGGMGLNPTNVRIRIGIACWTWGAYLGAEGIKNGIRCKISSFQRPFVNSGMTKAKMSGNYYNSVMAKDEAIKLGFDEAIMLDHDGFVSECSGENIFLVRDSILYTPPKATILEGITRQSLIEVANDMKIEVREEIITRDQLYVADEVFLCGTAAEMTPVREIDFRKIGAGKPGPITKKLQKKFFDIVRGKVPKYKKWLEYVK